MADTLKEWLRTRLGTIMDLTPETFGRYTRDGTLLAQILHSYDIINSDQLSTIAPTRDPALSRVNLRTLQIWLKLINVTLSEKCINDISKDKGAASLQLFYKVYLSLEGKDRLHFIALQKKQKYMNSRFDVSKVPEHLPSYISSEHPLSTPLIKAADTVLWHRNKFWAITKACRQERERFEALMEYPVIQPIEHFIPEKLPDKKQKESEILDEFTRKHPVCKTKKKYQVECCPSKRILDMSCIEDPTAAAEYIDFLKKRSKKMAECHKLKLKTQTMMMAEAWERLLRKQDKFFDEALGRRVLDQSRYEKQMLRKLCEVRNLRSKIVETRKIVDTMLLKAKHDELRFKQYYQDEETIKEEREDVEMEISRMCELQQRIREEKIRRMKEKHQDICLEIMNDFVDIAVKLADYRQANGNHIPNSIWNEWKMLFLKSQPIFEYMDYFDDVEEAENIEEIESEKDMKMNEDEEKNASPWDQFVPKREKEVEEVYRLGCVVLGYIVHRLLEILYPYSAKIMDCPVPRVKVAAIILGVTNATLHRQLQKLLKNTGIRLLTMEDAINHCLESYKREMTDVEYIDLNIISTTERDIKRLETKSKNDSRERHPKKIERSAKSTPFHQNVSPEEKQTQTPRQIPYDDMNPILSDTAYIVEEWRYAVLFEIDRIYQRLDVLNAAARSDVTFFLDIMKQTFHRIHHHIIERYKREIESIDEMANVFCFAIEEERPIQEELLLDGDRFVVRSNIVSTDHEQFNVPIREAPSPLRFRMVQLGRLVDIFQRIAPHGIVSERVLVYVLQDLVSCGIEDCYPPFVPCAWRQLRPPDIEILVERLFGSTEYIEWREFVLYAMDLPVPSHQDILKARAAFKIHDSESKEVVTCEQFHSISLWFLEISTLYKNFLDEKLEHSNFDSLENIMLRKEAQLGEHFSSLGNDFIERSEDDSSTTLRLMLAKQLLCRMYLVNRDSVHYTTMLLAFCKNENPSVGLGKAFSLAMGARVCTDTVEGEKYVEEQKRRVKELKLGQNYLREEVNEIVQEIMNDIINKTIETVVLLEKSPNHDLRSKRQQVKIQQLNGQNEVDPELLPEVIAEHLVTENSSTISDEYEHKHTLLSIEDETLEDHTKIQQDEKVIFWLPRDVCMTVLSTCLPWLASQADLFHTTLSLCEGIARVYDELRDEELNDAKDLVLAHRLVNHSFICELLCASSKFISKNMSDILRCILKNKNDQMT
ncbi:Sperm flagellar protein 2 [Acromyrmex echinatior]|uniref:Sperm flagellar protein 2 n=2 Tax=Acromyrmex echinatior TaxID=103372 RepID=F4WSU3_ACREC|nr:Sperm flagellar protein 2 [Acromyrmex echinatior]